MKKLFTLTTAIAISSLSFAQSIGIIGDFSNWSTDEVMNTTDNVNYTLSSFTFTIGGGAKFRQDAAWDINWGDAAFPTGTGTQGGPNIPVPIGTYDISFNITSGEYSFTPVTTGYDAIGFIGGFNSEASVVQMATTNGVEYSYTDQLFNAPNVKFQRTTPTSTTWGGTAFPAGTAVENANSIPLTTGYYNVSFNKNTLAYSFDAVKVGIIGTAVPPYDWSVDVPMESTDGGITHYLYNYTINDGVLKFRANGGWAVNWGGANEFPADTAFLNGPDIPVAAGTYDTISFNRFTGLFNFGGSVEPGLGIKDLEKFNASAFPVPAEDFISFVSSDVKEFEVVILDLTGKEVMRSMSNTLDVSQLEAGTYIYRLTSGDRSGSGKLIKK